MGWLRELALLAAAHRAAGLGSLVPRPAQPCGGRWTRPGPGPNPRSAALRHATAPGAHGGPGRRGTLAPQRLPRQPGGPAGAARSPRGPDPAASDPPGGWGCWPPGPWPPTRGFVHLPLPIGRSRPATSKARGPAIRLNCRPWKHRQPPPPSHRPATAVAHPGGSSWPLGMSRPAPTPGPARTGQRRPRRLAARKCRAGSAAVPAPVGFRVARRAQPPTRTSPGSAPPGKASGPAGWELQGSCGSRRPARFRRRGRCRARRAPPTEPAVVRSSEPSWRSCPWGRSAPPRAIAPAKASRRRLPAAQPYAAHLPAAVPPAAAGHRWGRSGGRCELGAWLGPGKGIRSRTGCYSRTNHHE